MKCPDCKAEFHEDHGCGTAVLCGSSYAAHFTECPLTGPWPQMVMDLTIMLHGPKTGYRPWEAPAGKCPICYHGEFTTAAMTAVKILEREKTP